jgi:hypothetical protein
LRRHLSIRLVQNAADGAIAKRLQHIARRKAELTRDQFLGAYEPRAHIPVSIRPSRLLVRKPYSPCPRCLCVIQGSPLGRPDGRINNGL